MSSTDLGTSEDTVVNTTSSSASASSSAATSVITLNQPSPTSSNVIQLTALTTASTPGPPEWRPYTYEHPLTAATTAMLNINGGGSDDPNSSGFGILYDYHYSKLASLGSASASDLIKSENKMSADIWSPVVVTNVLSGGNGNSSSKHTNGEMTEIFVPSTIQSSAKLNNTVLRRGAGADAKMVTKLNGHRYTNGDSSSLSPPSDHHQHNSHNHNHSPLSNSNGNGVIIVKEEIAHSPDHDQHAQYQSPQLFATLSNPSHGGGSTFDFGSSGNGTSVVVSSAQFISSLRGGGGPNPNGGNMTNIYPVGTSPSDPYYRVDYFANEFGASGVTTASRQLSPYDGAATDGPSFVDRYVRPGGPYKPHGGLPVDLPSPDSGIGTEAITPRDHSNVQQGFDYTDLCHPGLINDIGTNSNNTEGRLSPGGTTHPNLKRPWHDFGRQNETDKIQIPKLFSNYGLRYYLESPISTSQRREDDRITYINKGQFYGITLEYIPDPEKPIKSQTVKTVVMLVFREEKSPEDEIKAWQFWHGRQHSVKQRILDADTKNSVGLVGCIDEIAHNAIAVYWNPLESSAKINVAVQCLSTDFSSQKGVKGLPLHLQIDTYEDPRDPNCPVFHRGYGQIKVFCDKGAERKTRDEERRAAKRKLTATGRKKLDEMYHSSCDRSEFYTMSETSKPPVLFTPAEDLDKLTSLELHGFYNTNSEGSEHPGVNNNGGSESNNNNTTITLLHGSAESPQSIAESCGSAGSGVASGSRTPAHHSQHHPVHHHHQHHHHHHPHHQTNPPSVLNLHHPHPQSTILKFHQSFPPESPPASYATNIIRSVEHSSASPVPTPSPQSSSSSSHSQSARTNEKKPEHHQHGGVLVIGSGLDSAALSTNNSNSVPTPNGGSIVSNDSSNVYGSSSSSSSDPPIIKRMRLPQPTSERLMLYARQESEDTFTPLHLVPPTTMGLLSALEEKYKISMSSVKNLYRRNSKGIVAKIDDEMLRHYCHEDSFMLDVKPSENDDAFDVTLTELTDFPVLHHST